MENNIQDFRTFESLMQSANICAAAGTVLQIALGELCNLNPLCGGKVMSEKQAKALLPAFTKVLDYLKFGFTEFFKASQSLKDEKKS